jgi:hypothetical protein
MSKDIIKPWYCTSCWTVYHDHDGSLLAALKNGVGSSCEIARSGADSPSQTYRCGGDLQPLAWP